MEPVQLVAPIEQDENQTVTELDDGSAIVDIPDSNATSDDFNTNLAGELDLFTLNDLASDYLEFIEKDREARSKRDEQYAEGIRRTGLGDDAPGGAQFDGASRAVHPILAEGAVDFAARTIKELYPAAGMVKTHIEGEADEAKLKKARQKRDYLNWYIKERMPEYRDEKEVLLTQLPLGGSQYEKYWYDFGQERIRMEFVPIDKVLLPFSAASFYTSPRITHVIDITRDEFDARVEDGLYVVNKSTATEAIPEETRSEKASDKIEGLEDSDAYNADGLRRVYEIHCLLDVEDDLGKAPYILHIDESSNQAIGLYRNWEETDERRIHADWWVEDKFIPWRGVYGIGLPHLIGGLAGSLTGALRALLDSAHINTLPGAIKLKGGRSSGQNITIDPTGVTEMEAPAGVDDIRKVMMPVPFNQPSPVLFQLLDWITNQAKGVVATAEERIADAGNNMPVGTALALIEQGSQVFSSIHARLHESQRRALKIICRLTYKHGDEQELAKYGLTKEDFNGTDGIEPISDPNIFSEAQRFAQYQSALQLATQLAQAGVQVDFYELGKRGYELLRMDGVDTFLTPKDKPLSADPVTENIAAANGKPLKATATQDHLAHVMTHVGYILNPMHQLNPSPQPYLMAILGHTAEHLNLHYEVTAQAMAQQVMMQANANGEQLGADQVAMRSAQQAQQLNAQLLQQIAPMIQQATQFAGTKMPTPQLPPDVQATKDVAMAQIQANSKAASDKLGLEGQKAQSDAQFNQAKLASDEKLTVMAEENKKQLAAMSEAYKQHADQMQTSVDSFHRQSEAQINQMTQLLTHRDDNQTKILLEKMHEAITSAIPAQSYEPINDQTSPQNDQFLTQMQEYLNAIKEAKTSDALTTTMQGIQTLIQGQRDHQTRTMQMAQQLLNSGE